MTDRGRPRHRDAGGAAAGRPTCDQEGRERDRRGCRAGLRRDSEQVVRAHLPRRRPSSLRRRRVVVKPGKRHPSATPDGRAPAIDGRVSIGYRRRRTADRRLIGGATTYLSCRRPAAAAAVLAPASGRRQPRHREQNL